MSKYGWNLPWHLFPYYSVIVRYHQHRFELQSRLDLKSIQNIAFVFHDRLTFQQLDAHIVTSSDTIRTLRCQRKRRIFSEILFIRLQRNRKTWSSEIPAFGSFQKNVTGNWELGGFLETILHQLWRKKLSRFYEKEGWGFESRSTTHFS